MILLKSIGFGVWSLLLRVTSIDRNRGTQPTDLLKRGRSEERRVLMSLVDVDFLLRIVNAGVADSEGEGQQFN